jgi:hypothetical protein
MPETKRYWFGPKRIGFGIGPRSWQGWLVMAIYVALVIMLKQWLPSATHRTMSWAAFGCITAAVAIVAAVTYGPRKQP